MASPADATVVWFRDDLRVSDHPALHAAHAAGGPLVLLYVFDDSGDAARRLGSASRWWLHHSLTALAASLEKRGGVLMIRHGDPVDVVPSVLRDAKAGHLALNRRYAAGERAQDEAVTAAARQQGAQVHEYTGSLLHEPGEVLTGEGERFGVFTPFFRALTRRGEPRSPYPAPSDSPASRIRSPRSRSSHSDCCRPTSIGPPASVRRGCPARGAPTSGSTTSCTTGSSATPTSATSPQRRPRRASPRISSSVR